MRTMAEIVPVIGATRRDIENWIERLDLNTAYEQPGRGRARRFSYDNTLELAFLAALVAAGLPPARAMAYTRTLVSAYRSEATPRAARREWLIIPATDTTRAIGSNDPTTEAIVQQLGDVAPPVYAFVRVGEIGRRVRSLFDREG